ncbi:PQQ-dependent sugar dehydrogenase [Roseovarius sp. SCSIO 43702]|uniref:PQQ-dependent sugar dehydrogenase n=1 Tax=Roseovarius sp. SCSIO 43702 TaxID=2823043 RepID=UPI001C72A6DF|nr:PQQ-dependent sugar dehydrogenase [Roseovarius sp. SCSIO 43702]QYX55390.1 PQQ-dependent sugar dehydrogenase [Roseovarius sp. SCSIO 43702]
MRQLLLVTTLILMAATPLRALETSQGDLAVSVMADDLRVPWAFDFLPGGDVLVTERAGRLWRLEPTGTRHEVSGVGKVAAQGQGGLLDVLVPRDFGATREVIFTFATPQEAGAGTAVAVARLSEDATALRDWRVIWEMEPGSTGGRHFGSRVVEAPDGTLFVTVGERGDRPSAQDLSRENGSVIRITRQGAHAEGNPFLDREGAQPEIWSYGHRNPQGAALDAEGQLWVSEHGAKGGDEVNRVKKGANYGWPVISYGTHYSGAPFPEGSSKEGMEQPAFYWDPSIAPSGHMIYSGRMWPDWEGHHFIGSLKFGHIAVLAGDPLELRETIEGPQTGRVRAIEEAPDGAIWYLSEADGALYRLSPP